LSTTGAAFLVLLLASNAHHNMQEQQCMAYTVAREAGGESKRSKRAVLDVLQHRMRKRHKSCRATVSEPHQFSWYRRNIAMKVDRKRLQEFKNVARMAPVVKTCAEFFHSGQQPSWAKKKRLVHQESKLKFYC
jgi:spore germination cell wall hydrolase CwlJ-like protein